METDFDFSGGNHSRQPLRKDFDFVTCVSVSLRIPHFSYYGISYHPFHDLFPYAFLKTPYFKLSNNQKIINNQKLSLIYSKSNSNQHYTFFNFNALSTSDDVYKLSLLFLSSFTWSCLLYFTLPQAGLTLRPFHLGKRLTCSFACYCAMHDIQHIMYKNTFSSMLSDHMDLCILSKRPSTFQTICMNELLRSWLMK